MGPKPVTRPARRLTDAASVVEACRELMAQGRPTETVTAVLRAGYLELAIAAATEGMPPGPARALAAVRALAAARHEIARDMRAQQARHLELVAL